jgi:hypothetical protein
MLSAARANSSTGTVSGEVASASLGSVTIKTSGSAAGSIDSMVAYATKLGDHDYPYVYGGGHAHAGEASNGGRGHAVGYDCSGAVAAVLAAGGLWPKGGSVPSDVGMIQELLASRMIIHGPGSGPDAVTLYDVPGHIFMNVAGAYYGTGGDRKGGPGWSDGDNESFQGVSIYHFHPSLFKRDPAVPDEVTLQSGSSSADELMADGLGPGAEVQVGYKPSNRGTMTITNVVYRNAVTASGIVSNISATGNTVQLATSSRQVLTLVTPPWPYSNVFALTNLPPTLTGDLYIGDSATATYTSQAATGHTPAELVVHVLKVTAQPPTESVTGAITSEASDGMSFTLENASKQTMGFIFKRSEVPDGINPLQGIPVGATVELSYVAAPYGLPLTVLKFAVDENANRRRRSS